MCAYLNRWYHDGDRIMTFVKGLAMKKITKKRQRYIDI